MGIFGADDPPREILSGAVVAYRNEGLDAYISEATL